ncbi:MAG TPA: TerC family protein [Geobacteraceae bacterium]|nr:TerC family protein [Geobacteraceae bacterium]
MDIILNPESLVALATLTALEIVLGIDNIIFISILAGKLPRKKQARARVVGLGFAMISRIALLLSLTWMMKLTAPLFAVLGNKISGRDLILIVGGLFLLGKSTMEIHEKLEGAEGHSSARAVSSFTALIVQIMLLDIVFSLDSIITAIGMANQLWVMVTAIILAVGFMMVFSGKVSAFVDRHPTIKMLALSFLILIGVALIGDGLEMHIPKGYIYFAMAFSVAVEMLNMRIRGGVPVRLHGPGDEGEKASGSGCGPEDKGDIS